VASEISDLTRTEKLVTILTQQNAVLNREVCMRDIIIEELTTRIKELENGNAAGRRDEEVTGN
jgi:hypothetical protein